MSRKIGSNFWTVIFNFLVHKVSNGMHEGEIDDYREGNGIDILSPN